MLIQQLDNEEPKIGDKQMILLERLHLTPDIRRFKYPRRNAAILRSIVG